MTATSNGRRNSARPTEPAARPAFVDKNKSNTEGPQAELEAMQIISAAVGSLGDPAARERVLRWAADLFRTNLPAAVQETRASLPASPATKRAAVSTDPMPAPKNDSALSVDGIDEFFEAKPPSAKALWADAFDQFFESEQPSRTPALPVDGFDQFSEDEQPRGATIHQMPHRPEAPLQSLVTDFVSDFQRFADEWQRAADEPTAR